MINLTKTQNGFTVNGVDYILSGKSEVFNEQQANFPTSKGVLFLDTSVSIDNRKFDNIQSFIEELYK
jgi:hypothetical protein